MFESSDSTTSEGVTTGHDPVLDALPLPAWRTGAGGELAFANRAWLDLTGLRPEAAADGWTRSLHPDDRARCEASRAEAFRDRETFYVEYRLRDHAGAYRWVGERGAPVRDDGGGHAGFVGCCSELTDRRGVEGALDRSHALLAAVLRGTSDAVFVKDLQGRYAVFNESAETLTGRRAANVLGCDDFALFPPDEARALQAEDAEVLAAGTERVTEHPLTVFGGERRKFRVAKRPLRDLDGIPVGVVGVSRDVTDAKRIEQRLRELSRAVEQSPTSIVIADTTGAISYVNPKFTEVTGYEPWEVIGRNPRILQSGKTPRRVYEEMWRTITEGREWSGEFLNRRKDGTQFWEKATISALRDPDGTIRQYVGVKEDITAAKRAEEALAAVTQRLFQSQRLESVGRLAGGVAHDFNNLLNVIGGYAELLLASSGIAAAARRHVEQIDKATARAAELTRQLLAFSRKQVLEPKVVDLGSLLDESEDLLRRLIGEDIALVCLAPDRLGRVLADPGQIVQVLMNLAANARDAMPDGGRLTVELDDADLDEDYAAIHPPLAPGRYVRLCVSDTGPGMDEETQRHAFEPFFTTKPRGKGTGLGLATVYGIVKQSGGFVWVYSEPGHGTTFKIYLPRVEGPADASPAPAEPADGHGETILVVEDDASLRRLVQTVLERRGFRVVPAADAAQALEYASRADGSFDLLLTDVVMPGAGGRELAETIVRLRPETRVVFMSGYTGDAIARRGVLESGFRFLQKPFTGADLVRGIARALAGPPWREPGA